MWFGRLEVESGTKVARIANLYSAGTYINPHWKMPLSFAPLVFSML